MSNRMMSYRSVTAALMGGVAVLAMSLPASAATSFVAKQSAGEASSSGLIGTKVQNAAGETIGDVNYLVLDANGSVSTVVIGVGGVLGVGEKNVGVPFKSVTRQDDKNGNPVFVLDASKDELTAAPAYEWTEKGAMKKAADSVSGKTEGMTRADEPTSSSTGVSEGASGSGATESVKPETAPATP